MVNCDLHTFIENVDNNIAIYDNKKELKYKINPGTSYFFKDGNKLIIDSDENKLYLNFYSSSIAKEALVFINDMKKHILIKEKLYYAYSDLNLNANTTYNDGDLACDSELSFTPINKIKIYVNGVEVKVGGKYFPYSCYFSPDGIKVRINGDERKNDKLYWVSSTLNYNLTKNDVIDFIYLTNKKPLL